MLWDFRGRTVLITGGGRGIGRSTALTFAECGANVAVMDVDENLAAETVAPIAQQRGIAKAWRCDVSNEQEVLGAVAGVVSSHAAGRVNCNGLERAHRRVTLSARSAWPAKSAYTWWRGEGEAS